MQLIESYYNRLKFLLVLWICVWSGFDLDALLTWSLTLCLIWYCSWYLTYLIYDSLFDLVLLLMPYCVFDLILILMPYSFDKTLCLVWYWSRFLKITCSLKLCLIWFWSWCLTHLISDSVLDLISILMPYSLDLWLCVWSGIGSVELVFRRVAYILLTLAPAARK